MESPLHKMIQALGTEVEAIKKNGGSTKVELRGGERVERAGDLWIYRFVAPDNLILDDDTPVKIVAQKENYPGTVVSLQDGVLLIALEQDLGQKLSAVTLLADQAFIVERLQEQLKKIEDGEVSQFSRPSAERAIGLRKPNTGEHEPESRVIADGVLNSDQKAAIRRSLGSDTIYVWGPPGTGKTSTLARIVEAHYRAGRSVLLVSNTNIAVDTALERVAERLEEEPSFQEGLVLRHGPLAKQELRRRFGSMVVLEQVVARLAKGLNEERRDLKKEADRLKKEKSDLENILQDFAQQASKQHALDSRAKAQEEIASALRKRKEEAERYRSRAGALAANLERARSMGAIRRLLAGVSPKRLERELEKAMAAAEHAAAEARSLDAKLAELAAELEGLRKEIDELARKIDRYPPERKIKTRRRAISTRLDQINRRVKEIDRELKGLEKKVLNRCRILATTVYRTYLGPLPLKDFDVVVIDEASMLMPPLVYYAAGLAKTSVVIAGDFRQLPPIVQSKTDEAKEWLGRDVFERAGIPERVAARRPVPELVTLGTQYRMREPICAVINDLFYADRPLRTDPLANRESHDFPLGTVPLLYVDTSTFHPWAAFRTGSYSRYNLLHALLARKIIVHLAQTGFLPPPGEPNDSVGAISPYASQARLTQVLLEERLGAQAAGVSATVHRFQGNEKRVVILDLTDSTGVPLGRFLKATKLEEDGARLLNVAISRAREHVILIANFDHLRAKAPENGFVRRLLAHFEDRGAAIDPDRLLPLDEQDWIDGLHHMLPRTFALEESAAGAFTEGTFYPAFAQDLARARESVIIFSPFLTPAGTARWVDLLRTAMGRGVKVRIVTHGPTSSRPETKQKLEELVQQLRSLGISVDLRAKMHEKIAIIDGRILWHGSLNILSHRDTSESMLRIESSSACQQIADYLSPPTGRQRNHPQNSKHAVVDVGNPSCPECGGPTVWKQDGNEVWFECENPECPGRLSQKQLHSRGRSGTGSARGRKRARGGQAGNKAPSKAGQPCPEDGCDGILQLRHGKYGPFLGCSNYPRCKHTESV